MSSLAVPIGLFGLAIIAFAWPGVRALALVDAARPLGLAVRCSLGFVAALGVFSALNGPFLLLHAPFSAAMSASVVAWVAAVVAVEVLLRRRGWSLAPAEAGADATGNEPVPRAPSPRITWACLATLVAGGVVAVVLATDALDRRAALLALCALGAGAVVVGGLRIARGDEGQGPELQLGARTAQVFWIAVVALILFQAVTTTLYVREDADDVLYISEVLAAIDAPALGVEEPTHPGEALPANPLYAWHVWELWGAMLCKLSGLDPLVAFRSVLPPLLVLLAYTGYAALLRFTLPARLVPVALLVAAAYFTFGMSSHWAANNYLLPRGQQGKSFLIHVGLPHLLLLAHLYLRRPSIGTWGLILLAMLAALAWAPTSVFLAPSVLGAVTLAHAVLFPRRAPVARGAWLSLTCLPQVAFGVKVLLAGWPADLSGAGTWVDAVLFRHFNLGEGGGAIELVALLCAPVLLVLLPQRRRSLYPAGVTVALLLTLLSPVLYPLVAWATTPLGYDRLLWAVPFPALLGATTAVLAAAVLQVVRRAWAPFAVVAAAVAAMPILGGHYVWSDRNVYYADHPGIYVATNPYKMPPGLLPVAEWLARIDPGPDHRLLCSERTASHLAPATSVNFVFTRRYQTGQALHADGRREEAETRARAQLELLSGRVPPAEVAPLLEQVRASYVVLDSADEPLERAIREAGYRLELRSPPYSLWARYAAPTR